MKSAIKADKTETKKPSLAVFQQAVETSAKGLAAAQNMYKKAKATLEAAQEDHQANTVALNDEVQRVLSATKVAPLGA